MNPCPDSEQLRRFLADKLSVAEAEAIETHLEECADCQQVLERVLAEGGTGQRPPDWGQASGACLRHLQEQPPTGLWSAAAISPPPALIPTQWRQTDEQSLLRKRLLLLTVVCFLTLAVYAALYVYLFSEVFTLLLYLLVLLLNGGLGMLLLSRRPLTLRQLRRIEVILFAAMVLFQTWIQWLACHSGPVSFADDDWYGLILYARGLDFNWVIIVIAYGLLIPNTWRRAALFVGLVACWPVLLNALWCLPEGAMQARTTVVVNSAMDMMLVAVLAVFGAHRIEVLREQASRARRLGQYQLKQRLGAGGMGEVWLAEHVLLRRPCAVKLIRPERAGDPEFLVRFGREVQATAGLSHPNTVEVYDYGFAEDGTFYYAMEYLPGLTLEQLVGRYGPMPPERTIHLLRQVCGALQEAHSAGLVHRDIKPGNVLVCQRGGLCDVAKLLDFGLVRGPALTGQTLTQLGTIAGTPAFMSPEQAAARPGLDGRSDLYSLGAVAYFLLTGRPPFVRETAIQALAAHLTESVEPPGRHRADLPADLEAVVLRCLEKEPARRFQSADELAHALDGCTCSGWWTLQSAADWWRDHVGEGGLEGQQVPLPTVRNSPVESDNPAKTLPPSRT